MANQLAGFQFAKPYDPTNPVSSDMRYGKYNGTTTVPFASIAEALDLIKPALRFKGLQCIIDNGTGSADLYWFRAGTADANLVILQQEVNLSNLQEKPEGLLSFTAMYRFTGPSRVRIVDAVWRLNGANRSTGNVSDTFEIPLITGSNDQRIDLLVGDATNQLSIVSGVQSISNPQYPAVPAGKIMLASIHVDGEVLSSFRPYITSAAILGKDNEYTGTNKFVGPVEIQQPLTVTSFTGLNTAFNRFGYATRAVVSVSGDINLALYLTGNSLIELNATAVGTITTLATGYVANIAELVNVGVANITIKNNANIIIPNGQDFVLKPGYTVRFIGNGAVSRLINDGLSNVNETDLTAAKNRANHTGTQTASTISDFVSAVFTSAIVGIAAIAGTPASGDTVAAMFGKLKYLYDNLGMLVRAIALTGVDTSLTGTPTAADSFLQFAGRTINFISTINVKVRGTTLTGFVKTNAAVTPADTVESAAGKLQGQIEAFGITGEKMNTGNNDGLTGDDGGVPLLTALGKFIRNPYLLFIAATRELLIGNADNPGKLTIGGRTSTTSIPSTVGDAQASHNLNSNHSLAWIIKDKLGNFLQSFTTTTGAPKVTTHAMQVLDRGVLAPLTTDQASLTISANAGGVKVYAQTSAGQQFVLPMAQSGNTIAISTRFKLQNSTGSVAIHGVMNITLRRVGSVISVAGTPSISHFGDGATAGHTIGAESTATNDGVVLYFTPVSSDNTAYTGNFFEIKYNY